MRFTTPVHLDRMEPADAVGATVASLIPIYSSSIPTLSHLNYTLAEYSRIRAKWQLDCAILHRAVHLLHLVRAETLIHAVCYARALSRKQPAMTRTNRIATPIHSTALLLEGAT